MYFFSWKKRNEEKERLKEIPYEKITLQEAQAFWSKEFLAVECNGGKKLVILTKDC